MDVEKLKKVNQLSKEFKKHGLSQEEAIDQAGSMINKQEVKEFLDKSKHKTESANNPSSTDQYIVMLERNNRKIMEEVHKVKEEISRILTEFEDIKKKITERPVQEVQKEKVEKQSKLKSKKPKNEKQGKINPDDVSIEKMFYFGNK